MGKKPRIRAEITRMWQDAHEGGSGARDGDARVGLLWAKDADACAVDHGEASPAPPEKSNAFRERDRWFESVFLLR